MTNKEEGYEDEGEKKPEEKVDAESRLDKLEKSIGSILKILETNKAAEEEEDEKEKNKTKQDEPEDEKPEDEKPETEEKKKEGTGEDVKLPKAPAGETDETVQESGDKGDALVEKNKEMINKMVETKVQDILKSQGITKTQTPRTNHDNEILKNHTKKKSELALDFIKRAHEGTLTPADMNRETKDFVKSQYDQNIQSIIDMEVE